MRTTPAPLLLLAVVLVTGGLGGCGTSHVFVDDPSARIWANGKLIGRGHGELQQRGMPETTSILVRTDDGRQQVTSVKRRITLTTVVGALFTYGTCLIFCWEYPDTVLASLPPGSRGLPYGVPGGNGAGGAMFDPWLTPPEGWQPRPARGAPTTPPAPAPRSAPPAEAAPRDGAPAGSPAAVPTTVPTTANISATPAESPSAASPPTR